MGIKNQTQDDVRTGIATKATLDQLFQEKKITRKGTPEEIYEITVENQNAVAGVAAAIANHTELNVEVEAQTYTHTPGDHTVAQVQVVDEEEEDGIDVHELSGLSHSKGDALVDAGYETVEDVEQATTEELSDVVGIGTALARRIQLSAVTYME